VNIHAVNTSACGKVILLGEHAVVYGHPALAGALEGGATVATQLGRGCLHVPAWQLTVDPLVDDQRSIATAYRALREQLGVGSTSPIDLVLRFQIPTGAGLGSSAAMAVALARALAVAHQLPVDDAQIAAAAMASETVIHGRPSGLDHTMAIGHGFGVFTRAAGLEPVRAPHPIRLIVGHTGRERDTRGRVARIAELRNQREGEVSARFDAIAGLVARGRAAVERGAFGELGAAMNENQRHLSALEASCPEIERLCGLAHDAGAVGAKLTGGGGGGCVIALAPGREAAVEHAFTGAGFRAFQVEVGA
jgi:mevalonate kinase